MITSKSPPRGTGRQPLQQFLLSTASKRRNGVESEGGRTASRKIRNFTFYSQFTFQREQYANFNLSTLNMCKAPGHSVAASCRYDESTTFFMSSENRSATTTSEILSRKLLFTAQGARVFNGVTKTSAVIPLHVSVSTLYNTSQPITMSWDGHYTWLCYAATAASHCPPRPLKS